MLDVDTTLLTPSFINCFFANHLAYKYDLVIVSDNKSPNKCLKNFEFLYVQSFLNLKIVANLVILFLLLELSCVHAQFPQFHLPYFV